MPAMVLPPALFLRRRSLSDAGGLSFPRPCLCSLIVPTRQRHSADGGERPAATAQRTPAIARHPSLPPAVLTETCPTERRPDTHRVWQRLGQSETHR